MKQTIKESQLRKLISEEIKSILKESKYYVLNSSSTISTKEPLKNEFVRDWDSDKTTYLLIDTPRGKYILAGSGVGYANVGETINIVDDGNRTTRFPNFKSYGDPCKVIAKAIGTEEISRFPMGSYKLIVMK